MKNKFLLLSTLLFLFFSCENRKGQTIVGWKTLDEYPEENSLIVDTLGNSPYNNSGLGFLIEMDSILNSIEVNLLNDRQEFLVGEFEISLLGNSSYYLSGQKTIFSRISIYHHDWPWNQIYFYCPKYGIVAEFPGHSREKHMLVFMVCEGDTVYQLDEQLLEYFENDTILNPIPPMPSEPSEIIEVLQHI